MDTYIKITQFLLSLSLLIVLHELGHFIPAKLFKTKVEKFYLFFDYKFSLFKKKIGETVYGIGWIPLGGYVKIAGMIDESMDKEQMKKPPQPWEFRSKPAWQRLIIMLGGVTVNFLLGIFIYIMILNVWGKDYVSPENVKTGFYVHPTLEQYGFQTGDVILKENGEVPFDVLDINKHLFFRDVSTLEVRHPDGSQEVISLPEDIGSIMWKDGVKEAFSVRNFLEIDSVTPNSPASTAQIQAGDKIISIDNQSIEYRDELATIIQNQPDRKNYDLKVLRNDEEISTSITLDENNKFGVYFGSLTEDILKIDHKDYTFLESVPKGINEGYWTLKDYIGQFKYVFTKKGANSLGGFITIGNIFPATWNWQAFWSITAFLSIMLAFMNLLPIPALDGGHVVFTLYEMITGNKPSDKFLEYAQITGFVILMALLLFANGNDIYKWLTGKF